jgi:serine/threonine-protein kinase
VSAPLPEFVGRYAIRGLIGRGGMGLLYLAWDPKLDRDVALKVLREGVDSEEMLVRFSREARAAARLHHPNIVTIFDVGEHEDRPYIAMEYVTGQTLGEIIRQSEPLSVARKIELIEDLCSGLGYAHRQGIVHRDIKPANLMVDSEGVLKILDFGIARISESMMTQSGVLIGTLNYMSPEQVAGEPVDPRSDVFAVGAVAYELLTYRMAFPGTLQTGILHRILHTEPEPLQTLCPWLDEDVARIVEKSLGKKPEARYQDLRTMREDLGRARRNLAQQTADSTQIPPPEPRKRARAASTPAHSRDLQEIDRRRQSQIESWLDQATRLLQNEDFAGAVAAVENALLLDATDDRALSLYTEARTREAERQAAALATEAEHHLESGAITLAEEAIRKAVGLAPRSPAALRVQQAVVAERQKHEEERRRRAAIDGGLEQSRQLLERGDFEGAQAALALVRRLVPDHSEALALDARARAGMEARQRRLEQARAQEAAAAARDSFAAGRHDAALSALRAFQPPHEIVTAALDDLTHQHAALLEQARIQREELARATRALTGGDADAAERALGAAEQAGAGGDEVRSLRERLSQVRKEAAERAARERAERERQAAIAGALARADQADRAATFDAALAALDEVLGLDPGHADARRRREEIERAMAAQAAAERELARRRATARDLVERADRTTGHADAIALLRDALNADPDSKAAADGLARRERALEQELAERQERERRREEVRQLVNRAAQTESHLEAVRILRQALVLEPKSSTVKTRLTEREAALRAEEAAAAERERRRQEARRLVRKAAKTDDHATAIPILRRAAALDAEEGQAALAERERAHADAVAAEQARRDEAAREAAERKRQAEAAAREAEQKRQAETAAREAEQKRQAEEAAREAERKRQAEEAARETERKRQADEAAREAERKRQADEAAREAERKRQADEAAREAERKRQAEEAARETERKRQADEAAREAERKRHEEEAARQVAAAERKRKGEEAARLAAEEKRRAAAQQQEKERARSEADARPDMVAPAPGVRPKAAPADAFPAAATLVPPGALPKGPAAIWSGATPAVKALAAGGLGIVVIVAALLLFRAEPEEAGPDLPMPGIPTSVSPSPPNAVAVPTPTTAPVPATTSAPAVATATPAAPDAAARAADLRRQAERQLPERPDAALGPATEALRLQPGNRASGQLLNRIAVAARTLAGEARTRAARRSTNPTYVQAQRASDAAEVQFKQGNFDAAARSWIDARAGFDRAAGEGPQVASNNPPVQPPVTTSVPVAPATTTVPVPLTAPTSVPISPPTSVAPATTSVPPAPARNDQALIQNVLSRYAAAYSRLDVNAVAAVYPGVDVAATERAFAGLRALELAIENAQVAISGDTATVSCTVRQQFTPRVGRGTQARTPTRFDLMRRGDGWIITGRQP